MTCENVSYMVWGYFFFFPTNKRTRCFDMIIRFHASPLLFIASVNFEDKIMHKQSSVGESIQNWRFSMHILTTLIPIKQKWTITFLHTSFTDFKISIQKSIFFRGQFYIIWICSKIIFSKNFKVCKIPLICEFWCLLWIFFLLKSCPNFVGTFENLSERYEENF